MKKFRTIKREIRVLGVDDGPFTPHQGYAPVVGVVFRGGYWLDGVLSTKVKVDGFDATDKISSMIVESPHYRQVRVMMLDGVTFGGFNIVNIKELNEIYNVLDIWCSRKPTRKVDLIKTIFAKKAERCYDLLEFRRLLDVIRASDISDSDKRLIIASMRRYCF